jgi:hypothetical protein
MYDCVRRSWVALALAGIIGVADALAGVRVFAVPIFQNPDEMYHLDYALHVYEHGGPFRVWRAAGDPTAPLIARHPSVEYLVEATRFHYVNCRPGVVEADYGSQAFFERLDAGAPLPGSAPVRGAPWVGFFYPFGYYTALSGWLAVVRLFAASLTATVFAARLFSVLLLTVGLVLVYRAARELRLPRWLGLALTAGVGWFPLTSFVASAVQPDNLCFVLVTQCGYQGLRLRNGRRPLWTQAALGLALGALLVTKVHFFACAAAPLIACVTLHWWRSRPGRAALVRSALLLTLPSVLCAAVQAWVASGGTNTYVRIARPLPRDPVTLTLGLRDALNDYLGGLTFKTFWGFFVNVDTPVAFGRERATAALQFVLQAAMLTLLALALFRGEQVLSLACRLIRRGHRRLAYGVLSADPWSNSLVCFAGFMVGLYTVFGNIHVAVGRQWFPCLPALLLVTFVYAPRALSLRASRRVGTALLAVGFALFALAGNDRTLRAIRSRYYLPGLAHDSRPAPRLGEPMDRVPVPVPAQPAYMTFRSWAAGAGEGDGSDSWVAFRTDRPRHVYGIEVEYTLTAPGSEPTGLTTLVCSWWLTKGPSEAANRGAAVAQHFPGPWPQRVVLWVNDVIDEFRLHPANKPFRIQFHRMNLLVPRPASTPAADPAVAARSTD